MSSPAEVGRMVARIEVSDVLGYPVCIGEPQEVLELLWQRLGAGRQTHVVTLNAEMILAAEREVNAQGALGSADIYVSDGVGLTWAARMLRQDSIHRYPGIDLVYDLMRKLALNHGNVYLLGAEPGVAAEAGRRLCDDLPGLNVVGTQDGYFAEDLESQVVSNIAAAKPDLLLVGMGFPKQERFIAAHRAELHAPVMVGVGGALEVFAGRRLRAPRWMRGTGLEWAWRSMQDLSRLKRLGLLPRFIFLVLRQARRRVA